MRRAVVRDPEDAIRRGVRRLGHHLRHQPIERGDPRRRLAAAEDFGPVHVERRQIGKGPTTGILVFDAHRLARPRRRGGVQAHPGLNAGLFIRAEDELVRAQRLALPALRVEVEDAARLDRELRIAGKDPRPVLPRPDRVFVQPSPDGLVADRRHDAGALGLADHVGRAQAREWHAEGGGQFTRQRLDFDHDLWGEKLGDAPSAVARRGRGGVHRRTACARG